MEIEISGCVIVTENPVSIEAFQLKFCAWLESNGWYFGGGMREVGYGDD